VTVNTHDLDPERVGRAIARQALDAPIKRLSTLPADPGALVKWRFAKVSARDTVTLTVSVELGGDATNPVPNIPIGNPAYYPRIGDQAIIAQQGPDLFVMGALNAKVGRATIWRDSNQTVTQATVTPIDFTDEIEDTDGLWTIASQRRLTIQWPGSYIVSGQADSTGGATAGVRRLAEARLNGTTPISRMELPSVTPPDQQSHPFARRRFLNATDYLELIVFQGGTGPLDFFSEAEYTPILSAEWLGP
jgi:hypothetical protein